MFFKKKIKEKEEEKKEETTKYRKGEGLWTGLGVTFDAKFYWCFHCFGEVLDAIEWCIENNVKYKVVGNCTNIIPMSDFFDGMIIEYTSPSIHSNCRCYNMVPELNIWNVDSSVGLRDISRFLETEKYINYAWMITIPGTVGGAIYSNAGCYGFNIGDFVETVNAWEQQGKLLVRNTYSKEDMKFGYRSSLAKEKNLIIESVSFCFDLPRKADEILNETYLKVKYSREKELKHSGCGVGCVFKNITSLSDEQIAAFASFLELSVSEIQEMLNKPYGISAGLILEKLGLKGYWLHMNESPQYWECYNICFNKNHANSLDCSIGNHKIDNTKAIKDIWKLINWAKEKCFEKLGYRLELEVTAL